MIKLQKLCFLGLIAAVLTVLGGAGPARADPDADYLKAQASFERGDYSEAAMWLRKAVAKGHEAAQLPLAAMYREGQGVQQDYSEAIRLFTKAAEQGYPSAQFSLAVMYRLGQGVERDYAEAIKWYRKAAELGDAESQNSLGAMYEYGRGTGSSQVIAHMWYEVAEANGSRRGRNNRIRLAKKMRPADLLEAAKLSLDCMKSEYLRCD